MAITVKRKEGETIGSFLYRFNKRIRQSGIVREVRRRRFKEKEPNKRKRRSQALYRTRKEEEIKRARKLGL